MGGASVQFTIVYGGSACYSAMLSDMSRSEVVEYVESTREGERKAVVRSNKQIKSHVVIASHLAT